MCKYMIYAPPTWILPNCRFVVTLYINWVGSVPTLLKDTEPQMRVPQFTTCSIPMQSLTEISHAVFLTNLVTVCLLPAQAFCMCPCSFSVQGLLPHCWHLCWQVWSSSAIFFHDPPLPTPSFSLSLFLFQYSHGLSMYICYYSLMVSFCTLDIVLSQSPSVFSLSN